MNRLVRHTLVPLLLSFVCACSGNPPLLLVRDLHGFLSGRESTHCLVHKRILTAVQCRGCWSSSALDEELRSLLENVSLDDVIFIVHRSSLGEFRRWARQLQTGEGRLRYAVESRRAEHCVRDSSWLQTVDRRGRVIVRKTAYQTIDDYLHAVLMKTEIGARPADTPTSLAVGDPLPVEWCHLDLSGGHLPVMLCPLVLRLDHARYLIEIRQAFVLQDCLAAVAGHGGPSVCFVTESAQSAIDRFLHENADFVMPIVTDLSGQLRSMTSNRLVLVEKGVIVELVPRDSFQPRLESVLSRHIEGLDREAFRSLVHIRSRFFDLERRRASISAGAVLLVVSQFCGGCEGVIAALDEEVLQARFPAGRSPYIALCMAEPERRNSFIRSDSYDHRERTVFFMANGDTSLSKPDFYRLDTDWGLSRCSGHVGGLLP